MWSVQKCESWKQAQREARSEFIEQMRGREYGASETQDAWDWFITGWISSQIQKKE
jgi:hypothetical protein